MTEAPKFYLLPWRRDHGTKNKCVIKHILSCLGWLILYPFYMHLMSTYYMEITVLSPESTEQAVIIPAFHSVTVRVTNTLW